MLTFKDTTAVAIGEAMIEMAPIGEGHYRRGFAGDTFNTVWHMAQALGAKADVGFVTRVGQDRLSDAFIGELAQDGMDVSKISRDPDRTMGLYMIELDGVERSFSYWRNTSAARLLASDEPSISAALQDAGLIHLSGITLAILDQDARFNLFDALEVARANGSIVSFDPNIRPQLWASGDEISETISRFLKVTDIGLPSFDDEAKQWGDVDPAATIERFAAAGVCEVVVKNGVAPIQLLSDGLMSGCKTPTVSGILTRRVRGMRSTRDTWRRDFSSIPQFRQSERGKICLVRFSNISVRAFRDHPFPRSVWIERSFVAHRHDWHKLDPPCRRDF